MNGLHSSNFKEILKCGRISRPSLSLRLQHAPPLQGTLPAHRLMAPLLVKPLPTDDAHLCILADVSLKIVYDLSPKALPEDLLAAAFYFAVTQDRRIMKFFLLTLGSTIPQPSVWVICGSVP